MQKSLIEDPIWLGRKGFMRKSDAVHAPGGTEHSSSGSVPPLHLDARGLQCPLPVLRARKLLKQVPPGGVLEVLADDPAAPADFAAFCQATGNRLETLAQAEGVYRLRVHVGPRGA
jgi:tRNA 2-thiouridine synthesizing protein A